MITTRQLPRPYSHAGGFAYTALLDPAADARDLIYLLEDGERIGSPEFHHQEIRDSGGGRCSVWPPNFYFSASDGSDCNANGRNYQILVLSGSQLRGDAIKLLERDDEAVLQIIAGNTSHNNSFMRNFFAYYPLIIGYFERNGMELPKSVLEIGSGRRPFTGLRFLLEGCERYVANDVFDIQSTFSSSFVAVLRAACDAIKPSLVENLDTVFQRDGDGLRARGLETIGARSFEAVELTGNVDFIHSTSVLEHVQEPARIAKRMAELLPAGGYMFHSIDFRDHRRFDRPFEFLKLTAEEYAPIATENRLRPSEWVALLEHQGFELMEQHNQALTSGSIRAGYSAAERNYQFFRSDQTITPSLTEQERDSFVEPFRNMDLVDLSIIRSHLVCRKR